MFANLNSYLHNIIIMLSWEIRDFRKKSSLNLPCNHTVTKLISRHYHEAEAHAWLQPVLGEVRKLFCIVKAATAVRRVLKNCDNCKLINSKPIQQQIALSARMSYTRAYTPLSHVALNIFDLFRFSKVGPSWNVEMVYVHTCNLA